MHPYRISFTPADVSATGLGSALVYTGTGLPITAFGTTDGLCHQITITGLAVTNHSGKTFTVVGTDPGGRPQSEGIAGPNGAAVVTTTKYFQTVTSISVSATTGADTFNVGWTVGAVSPLFPLNWRQQNYQTTLGLVITGTISVTVQHCMDALHGEYVAVGSETWWPHSTLVTKTVSADGNYAFPVTATRILINSLTAGATVTFIATQSK
jgi:hypothetical protein